jgi:murein endopeptidase
MAGRCYAQTPMTEALSEAGKLLEKRCPGAGIGYLDASGRKGGKLLGHLSHKHGRDIDICFLGKDENGRISPSRPQILTVGYRLNYKKDRRCGNLKFDRSANLFLILALMEQTAAPVEKIFVEPYITDQEQPISSLLTPS